MATATVVPAHANGRTVLEDRIEALLVPSGSEPGSTHLVRIVDPDQTYRCDCRAAQYHPDRRCRHVDAAIKHDLAELLDARPLHQQFTAYRSYLLDNYPTPGWEG
jgi:hypothetical protein